MADILIIAQMLGILAVATFVLSYQLKKRKHIIVVNALSSVLYVLQYIFLGAFEGAALDILSAIATFAAHGRDKKFVAKHTKCVIIIINLAFFVAGILLYKNIFSLFAVLGAMLQTGAFWITDEKIIRRISFLAAPFWLTYNLVNMAYGSAVGSVLSIISIGIAILRYDILGKEKIQEEIL